MTVSRCRPSEGDDGTMMTTATSGSATGVVPQLSSLLVIPGDRPRPLRGVGGTTAMRATNDGEVATAGYSPQDPLPFGTGLPVDPCRPRQTHGLKRTTTTVGTATAYGTIEEQTEGLLDRTSGVDHPQRTTSGTSGAPGDNLLPEIPGSWATTTLGIVAGGRRRIFGWSCSPVRSSWTWNVTTRNENLRRHYRHKNISTIKNVFLDFVETWDAANRFLFFRWINRRPVMKVIPMTKKFQWRKFVVYFSGRRILQKEMHFLLWQGKPCREFLTFVHRKAKSVVKIESILEISSNLVRKHSMLGPKMGKVVCFKIPSWIKTNKKTSS